MAIFLTSGNPLGFRALGSGGRSAAAAYEQIARTLHQSLGPDHAALFAEPNPRATAIDWFANVEMTAAAVRLVEASPADSQRGLVRLEALVRDIETKIVSLQKSDREDERILGEMLAHALEFPDERAVFLVGAQPVITFWGYVLDKGRPAVSPLRALLLRRRPDDSVADKPPADMVDGARGGVNPADPRSGRSPAAGLATAPFPGGSNDRPWVVPAALCALLALLVLTCGFELVHGCALPVPDVLSGLVSSTCTATTATNGDLAAEQAKQDRLRAEYEDLTRQAALDLKMCRAKADQNNDRTRFVPVVKPQASPDPKPQPVIVQDKDKLKIPDKKTDSFDFLEGCWKAHDTLTEMRGGKSTGKQLDFHYCFNKDGTGATSIRYQADGTKCSGPLRATFADGVLRIVFDQALCEGNYGPFDAGTATCKRGDGGNAICEEFSGTNTKPDFQNLPFIRATDTP